MVIRFLILILAAAAAHASVDGKVLNITSGKPQAGATVTLYNITKEGPEPLESVKSGVDGSFKIDKSADSAGPSMIQTAFDGVTYNHRLTPGARGTGLELKVYNSSKQQGDAKLRQHMYLLEPGASDLAVRETYIFDNRGQYAWNNPEAGTLRFHAPADVAGIIEVNCTAPQGMPIRRAAEKTGTPGLYKVDFPIKPGESRIDVTFKVPFTNPGSYSGKFAMKSDLTMMAVQAGVEVKGEGIESEGVEPKTQATIWKIPGDSFKVDLSGSGELKPEAGGEAEGPGIQQIQARIYDKLYWVLGLAFGVLAVGFYLNFRGEVKGSKAK